MTSNRSARHYKLRRPNFLRQNAMTTEINPWDKEHELWDEWEAHQWELFRLKFRMENATEVEISIWRESDRIRNTEANIKVLDKADHPEYYWAWSEDDNPDFDPRTCTYELKYRVFRSTNTAKGTPLTEPMSRTEAIAKCEQIIKLTRED